jgi:hypothetical protein
MRAVEGNRDNSVCMRFSKGAQKLGSQAYLFHMPTQRM